MSVLRKITEVLRLFTLLLFRSIFIYGDIEGRHVPFLINLALLITQVLVARGGYECLVVVLASVLFIYAVRGSGKVITYSSVLALIPSTWYFIVSLPFTTSLVTSAVISLRVFTVSLSFLCFFYFLNPVEISFLLRLLHLKNAPLYPVLTWRVIPHIMRDMETALLVGEMKRVETWKSLAITVLTTEEYVSLYEEGLFSKPEYRPSYEYSIKHTLITVLVLVALIMLLALHA
ncbi:MAG: hypothetical protein ACP5KB_02855 [Thermoprotei archaeon]